jgi:hypothetical protein
MPNHPTHLERYSVYASLTKIDAPLDVTPYTFKARRYASTLRIPAETLSACRSLGALKTLAKRQYRCLARKHHPDTSSADQHRTWSQEFNRLHNAYRWFQQLQALPIKTVRETIPDYPLPWSMERRPLHFCPGWHETHL